jgi:hypothetical protein
LRNQPITQPLFRIYSSLSLNLFPSATLLPFSCSATMKAILYPILLKIMPASPLPVHHRDCIIVPAKFIGYSVSSFCDSLCGWQSVSVRCMLLLVFLVSCSRSLLLVACCCFGRIIFDFQKWRASLGGTLSKWRIQSPVPCRFPETAKETKPLLNILSLRVSYLYHDLSRYLNFVISLLSPI